MGKPFWRSVEYFFTGNYSADDGNNNIVAIGFGDKFMPTAVTTTSLLIDCATVYNLAATIRSWAALPISKWKIPLAT